MSAAVRVSIRGVVVGLQCRSVGPQLRLLGPEEGGQRRERLSARGAGGIRRPMRRLVLLVGLRRLGRRRRGSGGGRRLRRRRRRARGGGGGEADELGTWRG